MRQYHQRRRLRNPIPNARYAQRSVLPCLLLGDQHLSHRARSIAAFLQVPRQFPKPSFHPLRLDALHRLAIHPGCPAIAADRLPGGFQNVCSPHLVAQRIKSKVWRSLRFRM